jgi:hypothetical protein
MANYAVVKDGVVENIIVWDGISEFSVPNSELIEATSDSRIGGTYDGAFHYVEPTPSAEQVDEAEARVSAIEKLKALGLNDAEIASITGG